VNGKLFEMCGIFGIVIGRAHIMGQAQWTDALKNLFVLSETRGKEAAGLAIATQDSIVVTKDSVSATRMLMTDDYARVVSTAHDWFSQPGTNPAALAAIGHSRLVTNGLQGIDANNQPVWRDDVVLIHNGIVVNVDALWAREAAGGLAPRADVDTEVIAALHHKYRTKDGLNARAALAKVFEDVYGETSVALLQRDLDALMIATNTGSLYVCTAKSGAAMFFASERYICEQLLSGAKAIAGFEGADIQQIRPGQAAEINLTSLNIDVFGLKDGALAAPAIEPKLGLQRRIEEKAQRSEQARKALKRCTKCLLPETVPFITFDKEGVCSVCHNYQPWKKKPVSEVHTYLEKFRSKNGTNDCVVAFSGGRDSSYGLHLLKTEFDMNPICFSYDWGMVTDLARRNQARMCGSLGIEHIWVSADIKEKRANIRANVLAWMKKPDLGLIPLFMAGDKQFFLHANKMIAATGIDLSVFCTNNLEQTDFKTGFLGVKPKDSTMRNAPTTMAVLDKANLFYQYGKRFFANHRYLNRSIPDTIQAAFSYYGIAQEHLFLFDYIEWDETTINDTLINQYGWETSPDTNSTWRIGDGTAPFYNYIYHTVAGFTEFDTFRSNQIREGMITREAALAEIDELNAPRWSGIRDYANLINVDFDEMIRTVDRIPRLY
jgi:glutamine---fructose-6-phosphate transaminase (isomerizing)